jgi:hypothetical protein
MTDNFTAGIVAAWAAVITFVPKLVAFLAILLIGYFIAGWVAKMVDKLLDRMGFDRVIERGGVKQALRGSGMDASDLVSRLAYYALMLFVLQLAFGAFGANPISDVLNRVIAFLPNIFVAIAIVIVAAFVANAVKEIVRGSIGGLSYGNILATIASACILVVGAFAALSQLNIAPMIVNGLFYAMLAIVVGSAVIAIGGGGIVPMRQVWENALNRVGQEAPRLQQEAQNARLRVEPGGAAQVYEAPPPPPPPFTRPEYGGFEERRAG